MTARCGAIERLKLDDAWAWLDACPDVADSEPVALGQARGRVLAAPLPFPGDLPDRDLALDDGYAVRAQDTQGASPYNPLFLSLVPKEAALAAGNASACHAGEALPPGADAVLPLEAGEAAATSLELCAEVASGTGIGRRGQTGRGGDIALAAGQCLAAAQIALAASLGVARLTLRRRPTVALRIAGAKPPAAEALAAALAALIVRDGGLPRAGPGRALAEAGADDLVLLVGRSGWGEDDAAATDIAAAGGRLDHHGLALTPGGSAGLGWLGSTPLLLLPGEPLAALVTYELLAGRLLRRLAGRPSAWPGPVRRLTLTRKIASPIGLSEFVPVLCQGETAAPLPLAPPGGLVSLARADGFLIVPAEREGYPPGAAVDVVGRPCDSLAQDGS